jgi:PKD repeat protein
MNRISFGATRITALSALFFVILMLGVPSFFTPMHQLETTATASAGTEVERKFIVGVADFGISTLNPNTYTMSNEAQVIFPCYSTLTQFNLEMEIIGDLATEWSCSPDGLTWYFEIVHDAYFCDPAAPTDTSHQVTTADIEFSFMSLQENKLGRLYTYFPDVIESINCINDYEMTITLNGPFSTIEESWRGAPILPMYYWAGENFLRFENMPPIGSGAFYYATAGLPEYGLVELARNPIWYGTTNHGWQMHVDTWILKEELDDTTMWMDVLKGTDEGGIDVMMGVNPDRYVANLLPPASTPNVQGFSQCNGFVYEFNLNQMTDELRQELGGAVLTGENNPLLLDDTVKLAMSYCVDKYGFVEDNLLGLGQYADSLIPPQNPGHYWYPNPDPYDPVAARSMLNDAGWQYRMDGSLIEVADDDYSTYYPLCKVGGTEPLQFDFVTLNTDIMWTICAKYLVNLTRQGGFDLQLAILSSDDMNSLWYAADYDVWLWDWIMGVTADPVSIMEVFTYEALGTDQDVYWVDPEYDAIYYEALQTMDPIARRALSDQLQAMAYEMRGCQCVAYRDELYAVNTEYWAVDSLGDWNTQYFLLPDVWNWWVSMQMYPNTNNAPDLYSYTGQTEDVEATVDVSRDFNAYANDDDDTTVLEYKWFWGDGETSTWSSSTTASHTYSEDGYYQADVAVREATTSMGYDDFFMVSKGFTVIARDTSNLPPVITSTSFEPADPDTATDIWFNATATDPEGDDIYYSWAFGDGSIGSGQNVRHQYVVDGSYTATLSVDDHRVGAVGSRPVTQGEYVYVRQNNAPTITVDDRGDVEAKVPDTFYATASDVDAGDTLVFTWIWGDGTTTVTDVPEADHTYNTKGTYTLTVWADDQSGLDEHNVSDTADIYVTFHGANKAPVISVWTVTDSTPFTEQEVTFTATATDGNGDALTFTVEFEMGVFAVQSFGVTADNTPVTFTVPHEYLTGGTKTAYVHVYDGTTNVSSDPPLTVIVTANAEPIISPLEVKYGDTGQPISFSASVFDPDPLDVLSYYWAWGDGTFTATDVPEATHTYAESINTAYWLFVNDGIHNESLGAMVRVNAVPTLTPLTDHDVEVGLEWTFAADADDSDILDELNYTWYFGDGSGPAYGETVSYTYGSEGSYVYNLTVTDGFSLETHTLYSEATMTVLPADVNYPPEIDPLLPDLTGTVGAPVTFVVQATDPNIDPLTVTWDFGDGTVFFGCAVDVIVQHAYAAAMTYTYTVWVDDGEFNVSDSADVVVSEDLVPIADAGPDQTVDEDVSVVFDAVGSDDDVDVVEWAWTVVELADTFSDDEVAYYTFADPGIYTVELVVTDTAGQSSEPDECIITVEDATAPTIVATTSSPVDMGGTVEFNATGTTDNIDDPADLDYSWYFFDGVSLVTLTYMVDTHAFDIAGSFPVTLTVTDTAGNSAEMDLTVIVNDLEDPVPAATVIPDPAEFGAMVTLNASASTDNLDAAAEMSYEWVFVDDGVTYTLTNMVSTHEFAELGDITITLTVTDQAGNSASIDVVLSVVDTTDPVAVASADPTSVTEGGSVDFDASDSTDNYLIASYEWDFGDGSSVESGVSVTHVYADAGSYTATLTVTDTEGNYATDTVAITVNAEVVDQAPTADAGVDQSAYVGATVTFDGSGSSDSEGAIANYTWVVMDGTTLVATLYGAAPTHAFAAAGTYTVNLTVTDGGGLTDTDEMTVTVTVAPVVNVPPEADASADDTSVVEGTLVEFSGAASSDDVVAWTWTIVDADGDLVATLTGEEANYTFEAAGTYTVTLNVTDAEGLYDTDSLTITVTEEEEDTTPTEEEGFIEKYGLAIGLIVVLVVVALVAMMLLKKRKGGSTGPSEPSEPAQ